MKQKRQNLVINAKLIININVLFDNLWSILI